MKNEFLKILDDLKNFSSIKTDQPRFSEEHILQILHQKNLSEEIKTRLKEEFLGSGPLAPLLQDFLITEIIIDGEKNIFFEKEGRLYPHKDSFLSAWTFENFVHRIVKKTPDLKTPYLDGKWGSFRVHIASTPITQKNHHITLRRHPKESWSFSKLLEKNWASQEAINILKNLIQQKMNILIAGPTSSGKTSVLNACLHHLDSQERVVSIEDTDELILANPFSVKLLTRLPSSHLPAVDQSILVQQSLRMRPDRIVMGEVRGSEAKDLLMALATGHSGSMGTHHANHHKQALLRLELLIQTGNPSWSSEAVRHLILLGIQIIIILHKENGIRKLKNIYQITGLEKTGFLFDPLFQTKAKLGQSPLINGGRGGGHQTGGLQSFRKGNDISDIFRF